MSLLTPEDIKVINQTWSLVLTSRPTMEIGSSISCCLFTKNSKHRIYFKKLRSGSLEKIMNKGSFKDHATKVMNRLRVTIACLESEGGFDEIETVWREVTQVHQKHRIPMEAFLDMNQAIFETIDSVCRLTDDEKKSWELLLFHIDGIILNAQKNMTKL